MPRAGSKLYHVIPNRLPKFLHARELVFISTCILLLLFCHYLSASLKQEVALSHRQPVGRFACQQLAVYPHFKSFWRYFDIRHHTIQF